MQRLMCAGAMSMVLACGSQGGDETPEIQHDPAPPAAEAASPPAPEPPEPECAAGDAVELATLPDDALWSIARGRSGFLLAACEADERTRVRAFDDSGAPLGEARSVDAPCVRQRPLAVAFGDRYLLSTMGPCSRNRRDCARRYVLLEADGAPVGDPVTGRSGLRSRDDTPRLTATTDAVYMSQSTWDRDEPRGWSVVERVVLGDDGRPRVEPANQLFGEQNDCWLGPCLASDGVRAVALLEDYDRRYRQGSTMYLWREGDDDLVRVTHPPRGTVRGTELRFDGEAVWLRYSNDEGRDERVARIGLDGRFESWPDQLEPAPPRPDLASPAVLRAEAPARIEWRDFVGDAVGDPFEVAGPADEVIGDARAAMVVAREGERLLGTVVTCRTPRTAVVNPPATESAIAARVRLGGAATAIGFADGSLQVALRNGLESFELGRANRVDRRQRISAHGADLPLGALRISADHLLMIDARSNLVVRPPTGRPQRLRIPEATSLAGTPDALFVGRASGEIVLLRTSETGAPSVEARVPVEGRVVDLTIAGPLIYAALATGEGGAVQALSTEGTPSPRGRIALDEPALAIDSGGRGLVVVATRSGLHQIASAGRDLRIERRFAVPEVSDLAVVGGHAYAVTRTGRVIGFALDGEPGEQELAPARPVREGDWRLGAGGGVLWRVGHDVTAFRPIARAAP